MSSNTLLPIKDVLLQAWHNVKGVKGKIWFQLLFGGIGGLINILFIPATQARQKPINWDNATIKYRPTQDGFRLFITGVLIGAPSSIFIGLVLLILYVIMYVPSTLSLPLSIYMLIFSGLAVISLMLALLHIIIMYSLPVLILKNTSHWEAVCQSYHLTKGHLCKIFVILLTQFIIIGLIFAIPVGLVCLVELIFTTEPSFTIFYLIGGVVAWIAFTWIWIHPWLLMVCSEIYYRLTKATRTNIE